jgi:hypothetical protein
MAGFLLLICPTTEAEYFCAKLWTGFFDLPVVLFCRISASHFLLGDTPDSPAAALAKPAGTT